MWGLAELELHCTGCVITCLFPDSVACCALGFGRHSSCCSGSEDTTVYVEKLGLLLLESWAHEQRKVTRKESWALWISSLMLIDKCVLPRTSFLSCVSYLPNQCRGFAFTPILFYHYYDYSLAWVPWNSLPPSYIFGCKSSLTELSSASPPFSCGSLPSVRMAGRGPA